MFIDTCLAVVALCEGFLISGEIGLHFYVVDEVLHTVHDVGGVAVAGFSEWHSYAACVMGWG